MRLVADCQATLSLDVSVGADVALVGRARQKAIFAENSILLQRETRNCWPQAWLSNGAQSPSLVQPNADEVAVVDVAPPAR